MVRLPEPISTRESATVEAIRAHYERTAKDWRRPHLGASLIGKQCDRHIWLSFRWALDPLRFPKTELTPAKLGRGWIPDDMRRGRMLRLFERGQREEAWLVEDLRAIGCEVWDEDENGRQFRVELAPHFGGSCDGVVLGLPESPKTPHLLEFKTASRDRFEKLVLHGVQLEKPEHWAQMQVYMHGLKLRRAFYFCVCKDDERFYTERVHHDAKEAKRFIARARRIVAAVQPPPRIGDASDWRCRFCDHRQLCHDAEPPIVPERNCRTCLSSKPCEDGTWRCERFDCEIPIDNQKLGCDEHLFLPDLLWPHGKAVDAGEPGDPWVLYEDGTKDYHRALAQG